MLDQFLYRDAMHHKGKIVELAARAVGAGMQPMAAVIYDLRIRLVTLPLIYNEHTISDDLQVAMGRDVRENGVIRNWR